MDCKNWWEVTAGSNWWNTLREKSSCLNRWIRSCHPIRWLLKSYQIEVLNCVCRKSGRAGWFRDMSFHRQQPSPSETFAGVLSVSRRIKARLQSICLLASALTCFHSRFPSKLIPCLICHFQCWFMFIPCSPLSYIWGEHRGGGRKHFY